jgi:integrase
MGEIVTILKNTDWQEKNLFQFAFASGLRMSECMALEWECIDWMKNTISVKNARKRLRTVDMRQGAWDALNAQQKYTGLAGGVIFHDPRHHEPWATAMAIRRRWKIALRKANVRYRNLYQTRLTYASILLSAGESQLYIAKQMGHVNAQMLNLQLGPWIEQSSDKRERSPAFFAKVSPKTET